jgi:hypothetical protein
MPRVSAVGTLAWAQRDGGRLSFADRVVLARSATAELLRNLFPLVTWRLGLRRGSPAPLDVDAMTAPDTRAARDAAALVAEVSPPFLVNHSLRTYWFSRLLGVGAGLSFDDEALYVASLLHDVGLCGRFAQVTPEAECFAVRSARAALDVLERAGWPLARRERAAEAIALHVNGAVGREQGIEAHLMQRGVLLDATGVYGWEIDPGSAAAVFARHPLLDQRAGLWPLFRREATAHPACRGYFVMRYLQFGLLVRLSPWR